MSVLYEPIEQYESSISPPRPLRRNLDFVLLWCGQAVSSVGTQVSQLTFPLLVLAITGSPAQAGLLGALRSLPFLVLSLPAGAYVDRWDRKRAMVLCDTGRAIALGSIPVALALDRLSFVQLALAALIEGTLFTVFNVAETACLPQVVRKDQIADAVAYNAITDHTSGLVGPSIGGALFSLSHSLPFLADAISYAGSVISLLFIKTPFQKERPADQGRLWSDIGEGLQWLWRRPVLRFLAILIGGLNFCCMGYPLLLIVRAQQLHASSFVIGLLFATGGVGGIVGSIITPAILRRYAVGPVMVAAAWLWAITWLPLALAPNLPLLAIGNALGWIIIPITMTTQYSYRLALIPDELQGRVQSVFKLIAYGGQPLSMALAGLMLQIWSPPMTILILFVPQLVLALVAHLYAPLRSSPMLKSVEPA